MHKIKCLKFNIRATIILSIIFVFANFIVSFSDNLYLDKNNESLMSIKYAEEESNNEEIKLVVELFYKNYINDNMTDFQKEIQIIKYLVEKVSYDENDNLENYTGYEDSFNAYGALIKNKAFCYGYAKAFYILCKRCGIDNIIVTGTATNSENRTETHAWNQICLDGEWYNVDVTWEDPVSNVHFGMDNLRNKYINITDFELMKDHKRDNGYTCISSKYGHDTIAYYLLTGNTDLNLNMDVIRDNIIYQMEINISNPDSVKSLVNQLLSIGPICNNNSNYFDIKNDYNINQYVLSKIMEGKKIVIINTNPNSNGKISLDKGNWLNNYLNTGLYKSMQIYYIGTADYDTRILVFE